MEKVKVIRCEKKDQGNFHGFEISLSDGRKATGFTDLSEYKDQEVDLDIKQNDKGYWNFKYIKPNKGVAGAAPKSDRTIALECASRMESNPEEVIKAASLYLTWLKAE
jgi:hypothetical protein